MQRPAQKRMIQEFVKQFCEAQVYNELDIVSNNFYEVSGELKKLVDSVGQDFFAAGEYLGKIHKGRFVPGVALLDRLLQKGANTAVLTGQAEWLFVCGRDVLEKSVLKGMGQSGPVLVMNQSQEILGWGLMGREDCAIKNIWDLGDFLRRER